MFLLFADSIIEIEAFFYQNRIFMKGNALKLLGQQTLCVKYECIIFDVVVTLLLHMVVYTFTG